LKKTWQKANAVLELARQGYLSDIHGVQLFSKAGVDQHGLQKFRNGRGTNKVEGGPHGDIYRKFGALNGAISYQLICFERWLTCPQLGRCSLSTHFQIIAPGSIFR
jgi:hypothetical protein